MKNSNSRIFLLLFGFIFCLLSCGNDINDARERWKECANDPYLKEKTVYLAYFSRNFVNKYNWTIPTNVTTNSTLPELQDHVIPSLLSVCLCRRSNNLFNEPFFFIMPYLETLGDDMIAVCAIGSEEEEFSSLDVYDDEELFDLLMLKHQELIPSSTRDPFITDDDDLDGRCFDLDFKPAKRVLDQRTCLFSAFASPKTRSLYSGPLISQPLLNFELEDILKICHTTVLDSDLMYKDYCFVQHTSNDSKLACCCMKNPHACIPTAPIKGGVFCFAGNYGDDSNTTVIPASEYIQNFYGLGCNVTITAEFKNYNIELYVSYGASKNKCPLDPVVVMNTTNSDENHQKKGSTAITQSSKVSSSAHKTTSKKTFEKKAIKFCSNEDNSDTVFSITRCCDYENLCNHDLIFKELRKYGNTTLSLSHSHNHCKHKRKPALFEFLSHLEKISCDTHFNLRDTQKLEIYIWFNAKLFSVTEREVGDHQNTTFSIGIAKILVPDSLECNNRVFLNANEYLPICICHGVYCAYGSKDNIVSEKCKRNFTCQYSKKQYQSKTDSWFCYVQIKEISYLKYDVVAGHLEIKDPSACYYANILNNKTYCCINAFDEQQNLTDCTIEKMTQQYEKYLKDENEFGQGISGPPTHCLRREISEERDCPGKDGCFDIKQVDAAKTTKDNALEPAGCLGYAEEYAAANLPMTSLSLGCRSQENSNKCSVVQTPDGQQQIVCCCTDVQNGYCRTKSDKLPKQIGKRVSSFKEIKS